MANSNESNSAAPATESKTTGPINPFKAPSEIEAASSQKAPKPIGFTLDWNRAIHVHATIDDSLVKELTPIILRLKQDSTKPITVGIDSPGGSIAAVESLLGLLQSPDQDGNKTPIYTAATNRAYSAAASMLAFGDYAVAFPHSTILYHDVRYSDLEDVTPSKALKTARELERGNSAFAMRLANHACRRIIWVYLDLRSSFESARTKYASFAKKHDETFDKIISEGDEQKIDVVGFSLALFRKLSSPADKEIAIRALNLLSSWMQIERIETRLSEGGSSGNTPIDLVSGIDELVKAIKSMESKPESTPPSPETHSVSIDENGRADIKLLMEVIARQFAADKCSRIDESELDAIVEDYSFIKDINSSRHIHAVTKMMIDNGPLFFNESIADQLRGAKNHEERNNILAPIYPKARILWYYIVLVCKCLCRGEHILKPGDAQLLGLVDEVLGGGPIESRREFTKANPNFE